MIIQPASQPASQPARQTARQTDRQTDSSVQSMTLTWLWISTSLKRLSFNTISHFLFISINIASLTMWCIINSPKPKPLPPFLSVHPLWRWVQFCLRVFCMDLWSDRWGYVWTSPGMSSHLTLPRRIPSLLVLQNQPHLVSHLYQLPRWLNILAIDTNLPVFSIRS